MSNRQLGVPEQIAVALFKGIFKLIWAVIKAIVAAVSNASGRKSRAIYAPPPNGTPAASTNATPPPLPQTVLRPNSAEQSDSDPQFSKSDALADAGNFPDAVAALANITANGNGTSELHFKLAQRNLSLSERWSAAWAAPKSADFSDMEEYLAARRQRGRTLTEPLGNAVNQIESLIATDPTFPDARLFARELNLTLARAYRDWGGPTRGYKHQRRAIELSDPPIDYDTYDMAEMMAREGQCFSDFFDLSEHLFKNGLIDPKTHFKAALSYLGAITNEKYPLSPSDQPREKEFLRAALGHLEYCEQHGLETGLHWHNTMAEVLARLGNFDDAMRHFEIFKQIAATKEPKDEGRGIIATFGNKTVSALRACQANHR